MRPPPPPGRSSTTALAPLPIDALLPELCDSLARTPRLVLEAPPGAGKTTRVPRALLDAGLLSTGDVVVLQPRRLAARLAAARVAEELGEELGATVGYQVRFDSRVGARTRIRFVTEGVLTRRLLGDPQLRGTSTVVLDEFHERHLEGDLALALLLRLARTSRPDLRLIVMSATLDAETIASHLDAPRLRSEGRRFDVCVEHAQLEEDRPVELRVAAAVRRLVVRGLDGHVLVFLPGAAEIRRSMERCAELAAANPGLSLLPLHGELATSEQDRAVRPCEGRKIVFATNVAETSITIDGVAAVIDAGLHRRAAVSSWSGLPSLSLAKVSRASAAQRAGRAGRTRAGTCLRLYTKHDHDARPAQDTPEIRRSDLASLVLSLAALDASDPSALPWLEAPAPAAIAQARSLLGRLGALDAAGAPTATGRAMLRLPIHPRLARLVVEAARAGQLERGADLAAVLGERDLRERRSWSGREPRFDPARTQTTDSDVLLVADLLEHARAAGFRPQALRELGIEPNAARAADRAARQIARLGGEAVSASAPEPVSSAATAPRRRTTARGGFEAAASPRLSRGDELQTDSASDDALRWILLAFPDRVAQRRGTTAERQKASSIDLLLADGTTATLAPESTVRDTAFASASSGARASEGSRPSGALGAGSLRRAPKRGELLVAVDAEERSDRRPGGVRGGNVVVRLASAIEPEWLLDLFPDALRELDEVRWDPSSERALRESRLLYDALVLDASSPSGPPTEGESRALAQAAVAAGARRFVDGDALDAFLDRVRFAAGLDPSIAAPSDADVAAALVSLCAGRRSFAELEGADLVGSLRDRLGPAARARLDALSPERVAVGHRQLRVRYERDRPPWVESRLQDFFGRATGPTVGGGRVSLVVHLLAPNGRAVQVTTDLAGFWERHYPQVRKELMRRYPRHAWPEDPRQAPPPAPRSASRPGGAR